jgi:hypothetical protein
MNQHISTSESNTRAAWLLVKIHRTMFILLPYFVTSHKQHLHHASKYDVNEYLWLQLASFVNLSRSTRCTWMTKFLGLGKQDHFVLDRFIPAIDRWFLPSFTICVDKHMTAACYVISSDCSNLTFGAECQLHIRRKHKYEILKILRYCTYSRC